MCQLSPTAQHGKSLGVNKVNEKKGRENGIAKEPGQWEVERFVPLRNTAPEY
jgi:hypothetical protein